MRRSTHKPQVPRVGQVWVSLPPNIVGLGGSGQNSYKAVINNLQP